MKNKGISPILAAVLMMAVTLAVVGVVSGWAPNLVQDVTESTTNTTDNTLTCNDASVDIVSAAWNTSGNNETEVTVHNSGTAALPELIVAEFDTNDVLGQQTTLNLSKGEINSTTITNVEDKPSQVKAFSQNCGSVTATQDTINQ